MKKHFLQSVALIATLALFTSLLAPIVSAQISNQPSNVKTHKLDEINIKFTDSAQVVLNNGVFVSQNSTEISAVNTLLNPVALSKNRLFTDSPSNLNAKRQNLKSKTGQQLADLNSYFTVHISPGTDGVLLLGQLQRLPYVSNAYFSQLPTPAPVTPSYTAQQGYRFDAPAGMGVNTASAQPGSKGDAVQIADVEYSWNTQHEDITDSAQANSLIANGTPTDPFNDDNHGTAVAGISNGDQNGLGVDGIVPNAALRRVNANNSERGWDLANSIYLAQSNLLPGDVMLIEQQAYGPNSTLAPVEWIPAVYDAITYATASGVIVVEAAGNGGQNLNDAVYGSSFPSGKPSSGAIIVGAGAACGYQENRSRLSFSNYGSRVDVQGWGECVTTTGYGTLSGLTKNSWYTSSFNGTSSASALVAAVAASISSAKETQLGLHMTSSEMRNLLVTTGTAQNTTTNPGNIGPLPNAAAALGDRTAPSSPSGLTVTLTNPTTATLRWNASTDNTGIKSYKVYRNGVLIATTANLTYTDINLKRSTSYTYSVVAVDLAGNLSGNSNSVTIKTSRK